VFGRHLINALEVVTEEQRNRNDFVEMVLHHTVTCSLVIGSYMANASDFGLLILFVGAFSDIWVFTSRAFAETVHINFAAVSLVTLLITWAWMRIYGMSTLLVSIYNATWEPRV